MGCENFGPQACAENDSVAKQFAQALDTTDPRAIGDPLRQQLYDRPAELATDLIQRIQNYDQPGVGSDLVVNPVVRKVNTNMGERYVDTGDREVSIVGPNGFRDQVAILRREQDSAYDQQSYYPQPPQRIDPFSMITSLLVGVLGQGGFQPWRNFPHMRNNWQDRMGRNWQPYDDDCWGYQGMNRPNPMRRFGYQNYDQGLDYQSWRQQQMMMRQNEQSFHKQDLMRQWWQAQRQREQNQGQWRPPSWNQQQGGHPPGWTPGQGWNPGQGQPHKPWHKPGTTMPPDQTGPNWPNGKPKPDWSQGKPKPDWQPGPGHKPDWSQGQQKPDWWRRRHEQGDNQQGKPNPIIGKPVEVHRPPQVHKPQDRPVRIDKPQGRVEHPQVVHPPRGGQQQGDQRFHHKRPGQ